MDVTIEGLTAMDRMQLEPKLTELEPELEGRRGEFTEDDTREHGHGDMGIFTLGIPVTLGVVRVLETWIKTRNPVTVVKVTSKEGEFALVTRKDPAELEKFLAVIRGASA